MIIDNIVLFSPKNKKASIISGLINAIHESNSILWMKELCNESGIYDLMPLLLEFASLDMQVPKALLKSLFSYFSITNDPVILACAILLFNKSGNIRYKNIMIKKVEDSIDTFANSIYLDKHKNNLFLYPEVWYLFMFNKSKDISSSTQAKLDRLIREKESRCKIDGIVYLVCEYLLSSAYKVFDWDFFSKKSQRKWHYVTNKRTNLVKGDFY